MAEYMVMCYKCAKRFDANTEGYYDRKARQYLCPDCMKKLMSLPGKRGYIAKAIPIALLKLYFGMALLLPTEGASTDEILYNAVVGFALVVWAVWGFVKAMKTKRAVPGTADMLFKVCLGVIIAALCVEGEDLVEALVLLILGLALIAWGVLPYIRMKKLEKRIEDLTPAAAQAAISAVRICPHCGATSRGNYCEYCGSALI